ncbi:acetyl-CoA carboxylase biotin carboxylase subunit [Melioribacteraceae bacterium 4301-Me]|uniref:acetyl-CoA carboxylase biotin carboxylase subunit n=1 Tax=Pyranulibacter aquaticus TaxID=3163344 RepID=UPI003594F6E4
MFKKILIANRGEIAVRIARACRELNIKSAAIYSDADRNSLHVRHADEAYYIGSSPANESYLNYPKIIELAKKIAADAIHPGYGFLSENAEFISAVENSNITFIGPSAKSVALMGEKTAARLLMKKNNIPVVPGSEKSLTNVNEAMEIANEIGYPVMLKASAGGGGKGMRKVFNENELKVEFERAKNEALKAFGNNAVYLEKLIEEPKHIEVQIIADKHGNYAHLFERECSVQRRHQKIIEESPSTFVDEFIREKITKAAIEAAKACNYYNAGTIEFLMDKNKNFYFLEMNTRLQVEHPVTEMITGIDLVKEQISIAQGNKLSFSQNDLKINGHAIECRIYAEDINNNFAPSIGQIKLHKPPLGPGVRLDSGIDVFSDVPVYYDPILSKVITWGKNREEAIERMKRALSEYQIVGVITNIPVFNWIFSHEVFINGSFTINFIEKEFLPKFLTESKLQSNEKYELVSAIFGAMIKNSEQSNAVFINNNKSNNWLSQNYE